LRGNVYSVDQPRQGQPGFVQDQLGSQFSIGDFCNRGQGNVSGTTTGCFAVIRIMGQWTFAGCIGCKCTLRVICREPLAGVPEAECGEHEIGDDEYDGYDFHVEASLA